MKVIGNGNSELISEEVGYYMLMENILLVILLMLGGMEIGITLQ